MPKVSQIFKFHGSDGLRLRYFTPKFQKFSRATLTSSAVWITNMIVTGTAFTDDLHVAEGV